MPFPLLALAPGLIAWGGRALATYGLAKLFSENSIEDLEKLITDWVVVQVADRAGLNLDPDAPFTDASLAGAISERTGITIRSLKDKDMIKEDAENFAIQQISGRTGYTLNSVTDPEIIKQDLIRIGLAIASEKTGIPLGLAESGELDITALRENLLTWAKAQLLANVGEEVSIVVNEIIAVGGLEAIAESLNSRLKASGSIESITARQLALKVVDKIASKAVSDYGRVAIGLDKKNRKRELNRAAQERFRRAHGSRQKYIPLGMDLYGP